MSYKQKYLKYKRKYLLAKMIGGGPKDATLEDLEVIKTIRENERTDLKNTLA
jgi:hypothetical protein